MDSDIITRSFGNFYKQKIKIQNIKSSRVDFFVEKIGDKSALHYGCADWPVYKKENNLHYSLTKKIKNIDGYDINKGAIEMMVNSNLFPKNSLFSSFPDKKYDFLLIPETIEHVNNVSMFLHSIIKNLKNNSQILITAPNAFCETHYNSNFISGNNYTEIIHPDHNCWYSIYTLPNTIEKCFNEIHKNIVFYEIGFLEKRTMVYSLFEVK
jgi:2-polyprenyl-3-methyl-5-hydroxy-6-metoxy-1,4-benzoquinol methylase